MTFISHSGLRGLRDLRWGRRVETGAAGEAAKEGSEGREMAGKPRQGRFVMKDWLDALFFFLSPLLAFYDRF